MTTQVATEAKAILGLTLPMAASNVLEASIYFINTWMLAQLGAHTLAAGSLVTLLFSAFMVLAWGVCASTSAIFARYYGAQQHQKIASLVGAGNVFALSLGFAIALILWHADVLLLWLGQPKQTIMMATGYFHGLALAAVPDVLTYILFNFLQGLTRVSATFWLSLIYVPVNIALNYILMFGKLGAPAMGAAGIGYGTCIAYWLLVLAILIYIFAIPEIRRYFTKPFQFSFNAIKEILRVGTPVGFALSVSYIFYFFVASAMGRISVNALGAYQIVNQWLSLFFIITYCLSKSLSIRIGIAIGGRNLIALKDSIIAALMLNVLYVVLIGILFIMASRWLIAFDINLSLKQSQVIFDYASLFFKYAILFLLFDTARYIFTGALLGLKRSNYILIAGIVSWLILGLPAIHFVPQTWVSPVLLWIIMILCEAIGTLILGKKYFSLLKQMKISFQK